MPDWRRRPSTRAGLAIGVGLIVGLATGIAVWRALVLQRAAEEARGHLGAARAALTEAVVTTNPESAPPVLESAQMTSACAEAAAAAVSLRDVNGQLQTVMPLVGALEGLPGIGGRARSQAATLQVGSQLASAGTSLCDGLAPLISLLSGGAEDSAAQSAGEMVQALAKARPKILEATQRLEQLEVSLGDIQDAELEPSNRAAMVALRERLPSALKTMRDAAVLLDLMGAD